MSVPGESSHLIMAPEIRKKELERYAMEERNPRHAAVMMLLYPRDMEVYIALILRPKYEGVHSGQIALPGGKTEPFDRSYTETALRETYEEIGVDKQEITVIRALTKVYVPPSNFWVHPFFGFTEQRPDFVLQKEEVEEVIEVPLEQLINDHNVTTQKLSTSYAKNIEVPCFQLNGYVVWGATAMMLNELKMLLKAPKGV